MTKNSILSKNIMYLLKCLLDKKVRDGIKINLNGVHLVNNDKSILVVILGIP